VVAFAEGDQANAATEAGANHVGGADLVAKVEEGWTDFDVVVATPAMMPEVSKLGRVLGPQGKMPNPKVGTVTDDIEKAVGETKSGKVEYRTDRQAIVHMVIGKASFDPQRLLDNYAAVMDEITRAKPSAAKGRYVVSASVSTTMGPGIPIDPTLTTEAEILGGAPVASNGAAPQADAGEAPAEAVDEAESEGEAVVEETGEPTEEEVEPDEEVVVVGVESADPDAGDEPEEGEDA